MTSLLYLSVSAFLVSFTDPKKQLHNVKSVCKSLGYRSSVLQIYKFTASKERSLLLFIKHWPLNFNPVMGNN